MVVTRAHAPVTAIPTLLQVLPSTLSHLALGDLLLPLCPSTTLLFQARAAQTIKVELGRLDVLVLDAHGADGDAFGR